jgi:hypothetical protein
MNSLLPEWMVGPTARGITAVGLAIGTLGLTGACAADRVDYTGGNTAMFVEKGTSVYDTEDKAGACGKTAADATEIPVGQAVTRGNTVGDGQIQRYEFGIRQSGKPTGGTLPLVGGHSCEGTVFIYRGDASPVPHKP